jgi:two-component system, OmpR family, response regulator ChvI
LLWLFRRPLQTEENNNNNAGFKENASTTRTISTSKKRPYRILVVDDNNDILISTKKGLEDNGFLVDAFSNPFEVLSSFKPGVYDLLLIDIRMPQMNGFELYHKIRNITTDTKIKACFITAYDLYYEPLKKEFPGLNVGCFIRKPFELKDLVNRLNQELQ